jgi:hypothetical protein
VLGHCPLLQIDQGSEGRRRFCFAKRSIDKWFDGVRITMGLPYYEKKWDMSVWDLSNQLRAEFWFLVHLKLLKMVEYELQFKNVICLPTVILLPTFHVIYTIFFKYPTPHCPTPPINPACPPPAPSCGVGGVGWGIGRMGKVIMYIWSLQDVCPERNPVTSQRTKLTDDTMSGHAREKRLASGLSLEVCVRACPDTICRATPVRKDPSAILWHKDVL